MATTSITLSDTLGETFSLADTIPSTQHIPRARPVSLGRILGRGGFSTVCEFTSPLSGETHAAKLYDPRAIPPKECHPLRREAYILSTLTNVPYVVKCFGIEVLEDEEVVLKLEHIDGSSLEELSEVGLGNLSFFGIMYRVCLALEYTNLKRVAHNDIKPGNVMVSRQGDVRIIDWQFACRAYNNPWSPERRIAGTPRYMSPEQAQAKQTGPPTDWFACGAILYEFLTGKPLHGDKNIPETLKNAASFSDRRWRLAAEEIADLNYPQFAKPFKAATNPTQSYRTLKSLAEALSNYLS